MTKEEIEIEANKFAEKHGPSNAYCSKAEIVGNYREIKGLKKGFIAGYEKGLAEGKPKWHNLRKNPDDLPKEDCTEVMFITEYKSETLAGTYINGGGEGTPIFDTFGIAFYEVEQVIAWCELPKLEE